MKYTSPRVDYVGPAVTVLQSDQVKVVFVVLETRGLVGQTPAYEADE